MLNNNRVQRYNKKMTLKSEKTKKSQMPEGRWDFYINMLYSAKKYRTKSRRDYSAAGASSSAGAASTAGASSTAGAATGAFSATTITGTLISTSLWK